MLSSGLRFLFRALEVPDLRVRKRPPNIAKIRNRDERVRSLQAWMDGCNVHPGEDANVQTLLHSSDRELYNGVAAGNFQAGMVAMFIQVIMSMFNVHRPSVDLDPHRSNSQH